MKKETTFWGYANDLLKIVVSPGFIPGLLVGVFFGSLVFGIWIRHASERYTVMKIGNTVMRTDTTTGRSWLYVGYWSVVPDTHTNQPEPTVPLTFVPDPPAGFELDK